MEKNRKNILEIEKGEKLLIIAEQPDDKNIRSRYKNPHLHMDNKDKAHIKVLSRALQRLHPLTEIIEYTPYQPSHWYHVEEFPKIVWDKTFNTSKGFKIDNHIMKQISEGLIKKNDLKQLFDASVAQQFQMNC